MTVYWIILIPLVTQLTGAYYKGQSNFLLDEAIAVITFIMVYRGPVRWLENIVIPILRLFRLVGKEDDAYLNAFKEYMAELRDASVKRA